MIREFNGHTEPIFSVAFSPDGQFAYSTSGGGYADGKWHDGPDSVIRIWNVATGQETGTLEGHKGIVWGVAVSPDGRRLLSCGRDRTLILWDAATGALIRRFKGHTASIGCVAFLPDGRRAVSSSLDSTIRLWDLETGDEIHSFRGTSDGLAWVAVSPDGSKLLSADLLGYELKLWDVESRKSLHRVKWGNLEPNARVVHPRRPPRSLGGHGWGNTDVSASRGCRASSVDRTGKAPCSTSHTVLPASSRSSAAESTGLTMC